MITRYDFGAPVSTGAAVLNITPSHGDIPHFQLEETGEGLRLSCPLEEDTCLFGLGETVWGINKRGHIYRAWNTDETTHTEDKKSLYSAHNFLIVSSPSGAFGIFVDDPGEVIFDLGATSLKRMTIDCHKDVTLYIIEGGSCVEICREFRELTGPSYVPPYWAFGYIQSRWGYAGEEDVSRVTRLHRENHIPLDGICLDIDYMDRFRDFTLNPKTVPDLKKMVDKARKDRVHIIPIIDAGIPANPDDATYLSGIENDTFVKEENGEVFRAAVWPGLSCFPDFLSPRASAWFGDRYRPLLEAGIDGFWNDMNEPSLFYSAKGIRKAWESLRQLNEENIDTDGNWRMHQAAGSLANSMEDYRSFYHDMNGTRVNHERVHNLYGFGMTRASREGFDRFDGSKRYLLFSRSSYIGAHRYGGMWMGDNCAWWSHIKLNLQMLPGLNMCGFLYCGADIGGFGKDTTPDLLLRWLQLGIFTPLMRNHTSIGTRQQEIYQFECMDEMRNMVRLRYALIPYLYSEYMKAVQSSGMLFRPLAFDSPDDPMARHTEDQLMLGGECMIAPVYEPNAAGRTVYVPERMLVLRMRSPEDMDAELLEKGTHFVRCALGEVLLFLREGCAIPFAEPTESTKEARKAPVHMMGWPFSKPYLLYLDDGVSYAPGWTTLLDGTGEDGYAL